MVIELAAVESDWAADWEEARCLLRIQTVEEGTIQLLGWTVAEAMERERRLHR